MAEYKGSITLINVYDGDAAENIKSVDLIKTYYATSVTNELPPDDDLYELVLTEEDNLDLTQGNLYFKNGVLLASKDGEELNLVVDNSIIIGAGSSWSENVPAAEPGLYIWTKTVTTYTDGSAHVVYSVSRIGADGPQGSPGKAEIYSIVSNQQEILKFETEEGIEFSPQNFVFSIYRNNPDLPSGTEQVVENISLNFLKVSAYNYENATWSFLEPVSDYIALNESKQFSIDLKKIYDSITDFAIALMLDTTIIKIEYEHTNEQDKKFVAQTYIDVKYAISKDMAKLGIEANRIVASIQEAGLVFSADGLTLKNGAFKIVRNIKDDNNYQEEELLLHGTSDGDLILRGKIYASDGVFNGTINATSGTFNGTINAENGKFSGEIEAKRGTIGGFIIEQDQLISQPSEGSGAPAIILNGKDGRVVANNIVLGTGAEINNFIKIGNLVYLSNPEKNNGIFINVKDSDNNDILVLNSQGQIKIGKTGDFILIDGANGSIESYNYNTNNGWQITNEKAIFNNITARGSIRASVLEYGETQAIGGALLVRPSSIITQVENKILTLESINGFKKGDICRVDLQYANNITQQYYKIEEVDLANKTLTLEQDADSSLKGKVIVNLGQQNDDVGICINGSVDDSFGIPQAISVFQTIFEEGKEPQRKFPIILGKLPNGGNYGALQGTYGLYAENVLLKGALVTQLGTESVYSGINTIYNSSADQPKSDKYQDYFKDENNNPTTGEILMWAGAQGTDKNSIENSKFFIDKNGNLFAGSGYFKGTIITDARITASEIVTAKITGNGEKPALYIEDATKGIWFRKKKGENYETVFEVNENSIIANVQEFVLNNNFTIGDSGSLSVPKLYITEKTNEGIVIEKNRISYSSGWEELENGIKNYIDFSDSSISFANYGETKLEITNSNVKFNSEILIQENIVYDQNMRYERIIDEEENLIGYDLYIE